MMPPLIPRSLLQASLPLLALLSVCFSACRTAQPVPKAPEAPLFEARIELSTATGMGSRLEPGLLEYKGISLANLVAFSSTDGRRRLAVSSPRASQRYDVLVRCGGPETPDPRLLREAVERTFGLKTDLVIRPVDVYFIKTAGRPGTRIKRSTRTDDSGGGGGSGPDGGELSQENGTIADLASSLEGYVDRPVIDESGLPARYDLRLQWEPKKKGSLERAMVEQLGLTLVPGKAEIEVLEVRATR